MRTPSELPSQGNWAATPAANKSSVFGNFVGAPTQTFDVPDGEPPQPVALEGSGTVDAAVARSYLYRFLALGLEYPSIGTFDALGEVGESAAYANAIGALVLAGYGGLAEAAGGLKLRLDTEKYAHFRDAYLAAFGHAARGSVPMNEIEYGDLKADMLIQPHRLADVAAFYRAFGVQLDSSATERVDHVCVELEFMSVLAAKEASALEGDGSDEHLQICRHAQKEFLREHIGRWGIAFGVRLASSDPDGIHGAVGKLLQVFLKEDCAKFSVRSGSPDLVLRNVDETAESNCDGCGTACRVPGS